jgi:hypothetical protein
MAKTPGYAASHFCIEIDGKVAGFLSSFLAPSMEVERITQGIAPDGFVTQSFGNPKIGPATLSFALSQSPALLDWIASLLRKDVKERDVVVLLADQSYQIKRRIEMRHCLITEVRFSAFDAKDGKAPVTATVTFQPTGIQYALGNGKLSATASTKAKAWLASNFRMSVVGLDSKYVTRIELPTMTAVLARDVVGSTRVPTGSYASVALSDLKATYAGPGFDAAQQLAAKVLADGVIEESEYMTITIDVLDPAMKTLGTIAGTYCAPRKFGWASELRAGQEHAPEAVLEFAVETLTVVPLS